MDQIAVLTSGGDAPGMNAAVRSVVRTGLSEGFRMYGVNDGYEGLLEGNIKRLEARDVGGVLERAGTVLGTSRCEEFKTTDGQQRALENLRDHQLDAAVIIGGSGSQKGSLALARQGFPVIGIASTIDNDLAGTDLCLGVDTALNVALEAIDQLRATASSHQRGSIVEVMGRDHGYLALHAGLAGGAEAVVIPEVETDPEELVETLRYAEEQGKNHVMIVVAEGAHYNADRLRTFFHEETERKVGFGLRFTILGHIQRGGRPTAFDRELGTRLGARAIQTLNEGETNQLIGWTDGHPGTTPLESCAEREKSLDTELLDLVHVLSR